MSAVNVDFSAGCLVLQILESSIKYTLHKHLPTHPTPCGAKGSNRHRIATHSAETQPGKACICETLHPRQPINRCINIAPSVAICHISQQNSQSKRVQRCCRSGIRVTLRAVQSARWNTVAVTGRSSPGGARNKLSLRHRPTGGVPTAAAPSPRRRWREWRSRPAAWPPQPPSAPRRTTGSRCSARKSPCSGTAAIGIPQSGTLPSSLSVSRAALAPTRRQQPLPTQLRTMDRTYWPQLV